MKYKLIAVIAGITIVSGIGVKLFIDKFVGDLFGSVFKDGSAGINRAIDEGAQRYSFNFRPDPPVKENIEVTGSIVTEDASNSEDEPEEHITKPAAEPVRTTEAEPKSEPEAKVQVDIVEDDEKEDITDLVPETTKPEPETEPEVVEEDIQIPEPEVVEEEESIPEPEVVEVPEENIDEPEVIVKEEILLAEKEEIEVPEKTEDPIPVKKPVEETKAPESPGEIVAAPTEPSVPVPDTVKEIEAQVEQADKNLAISILLGRLTASDIAALTALISNGNVTSEDIERAKDIIRGKVNENEKDDLKDLFEKYEHLID